LSTGKVKGTLSLAKRPLLKNSPPGCFINSPLVNAPFRQGISLTAVSDQRLCLWIPPAFLKNCWTKKLLVQKSLKDFFDKLRVAHCHPSVLFLYEKLNVHATLSIKFIHKNNTVSAFKFKTLFNNTYFNLLGNILTANSNK